MLMNPFRWTADQQIVFWLSLMSGAALGDVVGYFAYLSGAGIVAYSFAEWVLYFGLWWTVLGGVLGAGTAYLLWER